MVEIVVVYQFPFLFAFDLESKIGGPGPLGMGHMKHTSYRLRIESFKFITLNGFEFSVYLIFAVPVSTEKYVGSVLLKYEMWSAHMTHISTNFVFFSSEFMIYN